VLNPKYLFLICLVAFISCKKEKKKDPRPTGQGQAIRAHYSDVLETSSLSQNPLFVTRSGSSASDNFYVIQKMSGSSYNLIVSDREANVESTKLIELNADSLVDVCGSRVTNEFFTLTASNKYSYNSGAVMSAYVYSSSYYDSTNCGDDNYAYSYEFNSNFQLTTPVPIQNFSQLKKFDETGHEVWSRTLDGNFFSGNALETDLEGNIYVLTATKPAMEPKKVEFLSGIIPYYTFKRDSNSFTLHKFTAFGNLLFKKTITNVHDGTPFSFEPGLALSGTAVFVWNLNNLFTFDLECNLISKVKPLKDVCYNLISSAVSSPFIPNLIVKGKQYFTFSSSNPYYTKLNVTAANTTVNNTKIPTGLFAVDNLQNTYAGSGTVLSKISNSGTEVYKKTLFNGTNSFTVNARNHVIDKNNSFYCFSLENGVIKVYKFDENGNFN
jgi:hypothetical protein